MSVPSPVRIPWAPRMRSRPLRTCAGVRDSTADAMSSGRRQSAQRRNALIEWRMAHEEPLDAAGDRPAGDAEGGELLRRQRLMRPLERLQGCDHVGNSGKVGPAAVSAELAPAGEGHDD